MLTNKLDRLMNEFEQHLRRGTGSHSSYLLPSEMKRKVFARRRAGFKCVILCNKIKEQNNLARSLNAKAHTSLSGAETHMEKANSLFEEQKNNVKVLGVRIALAAFPLTRAVRALGAIKRLSRLPSNSTSAVRAAREVFEDVQDIYNDAIRVRELSTEVTKQINSSNKKMADYLSYLNDRDKAYVKEVSLRRQYKHEGCAGSC